MNTSSIRLSLTSLAALAAIAYGSSTTANPAADGYINQSEKVSFADLNLGTQAGAAALYKRIQSAARRVCGSDTTDPRMQLQRDWRACYETAVTNAVAKVNSPMLTALHSSNAPDLRIASTARPAMQK